MTGMHRTKREALLAVLIAGVASGRVLARDDGLPDTKPDQVGMSAQKLGEVGQALQTWVDQKRLPGGVVLAARKGKVVLRQARGVADIAAKRPMSADMPMMVASMTKPITATAIMMLAEQGKLSIDDPVSKHLPAFKGQKVIGGGTGRITIRQLLCHMSGMSRVSPEAYEPVKPAAGQTVLSKFVGGLAAEPLECKPGTKFLYSSNGYSVLGRIIEVITNVTCEQFIQSSILGPLGMKHSTFRIDAALSKRMPVAYARSEGGKGLRVDDPAAGWVAGLEGELAPIYPAGGLVSTIDDMAVFLQMFANGGAYGSRRYLKPVTVELMTQNHTRGAESGWGLGWSKYYKKHAPIGASPRSYNHAGKFGTYGFVDPSLDLIVLVFQQIDLRAHVAEDSFRLVRSALQMPNDQPPPYGLPLVFHADFEDGKTDRWEPTDPKAWRIKKVDGRAVYNQYRPKSEYKPKYRSPFNISLIKDLRLADFVMDVTLRSTTKTYGHRDMCLFFGHQSPERFYYVHMGFRSDPHSNSIMIVKDKPRVSIIQDKMANPKADDDPAKAVTHWRAKGTNWTDAWHRVRLVRRADAGTIEIYFNDFATPHMYAIDKTFPTGRVGIGSFDDTGYWDDVKIYGHVVR